MKPRDWRKQIFRGPLAKERQGFAAAGQGTREFGKHPLPYGRGSDSFRGSSAGIGQDSRRTRLMRFARDRHIGTARKGLKDHAVALGEAKQGG